MATENLQLIASNPKTSCWVNASAGSGKTKVLIDRIICLLLCKTDPERILCLTYSRAAAAEMQQRLLKRLKSMEDFTQIQLEQCLIDLGEETSSLQLQQAKSLYKIILNKPVAIQTVHSFCQTLLQQQLGGNILKPIPRVMENFEEKTYLAQAFEKLIETPQAIEHLKEFLAFHGDGILLSYLSRTTQTSHNANAEKVKERLHELFDIAQAPAFPMPNTDVQKYIKGLLNVEPPADSPLRNHPFVQTFLTQKGEVRKKILPMAIQKQYTDAEDLLKIYAEQLCHYFLQKIRFDQVQKSLQFWHLQQIFIGHYKNIKAQNNLWDFYDLIQKTLELLKLDDFDEILFKLNSRIEHILVDEAQDTSADQWQVIEHLVNGLFTQQDVHKSIFVVGDEKQSIYSFQGADIRVYQAMQEHFEALCKTLGIAWENVSLVTSFRSGSEILKLVDSVFANNADGLGRKLSNHIAFHPFEGKCESFPLVNAEPPDVEPWPIFETYKEHIKPERILAEHVLTNLQDRIENGLFLESEQRNATWSDMMILMRKRGLIMQELSQYCQEKAIPYTAFEPINLMDNLGVQDILSVIEFMLMPYNDLNLAGLLKSPWMQAIQTINEEELFKLCHKRQQSLWKNVKTHYPAQAKILSDLLELAPHNAYSYFQIAFNTINKECALLQHFMEDVFKRFHLLNFGIRELIEHLHSYPPLYTQSSHQDGLKLSTVHGSKGLEAPIVVILDNGDEASIAQEVVLYDPVGQFWFLKPPKPADTLLTEAIKEHHKQALDFERNRLFYVALTRAKEQLMMGGLDHEENESSWYWRVNSSA